MIFISVPLVIGFIFLALQLATAWDRRGKVMRVITLDDGRTKTVWAPEAEPMAETFARVKAELDEAYEQHQHPGQSKRVVTLADGRTRTVWAPEWEDPLVTTDRVRREAAAEPAAPAPNPWAVARIEAPQPQQNWSA